MKKIKANKKIKEQLENDAFEERCYIANLYRKHEGSMWIAEILESLYYMSKRLERIEKKLGDE